MPQFVITSKYRNSFFKIPYRTVIRFYGAENISVASALFANTKHVFDLVIHLSLDLLSLELFLNMGGT